MIRVIQTVIITMDIQMSLKILNKESITFRNLVNIIYDKYKYFITIFLYIFA
jgi:hypothetical protein